MPAAEPVPDPLDDDLALLVAAAEAAGDIAMRHWRNDPHTWEKADGQGPVSEADLEVDAQLHALLRPARPGFRWMSEESEGDPAPPGADTLFVVDPIDGTRAFVAGEKSWAHALAIVSRGVPVAGVVHLPAMGLLYAARHGGGATCNGRPLQVSGRAEPEGAHVLATRPTFAPPHWQGRIPSMTRHFRPSLAYRLALVAEGRFDAMLTLRDSWEWDIAAGALLVAEAGGHVRDRAGAPLVFDGASRLLPGVVAGPAALVAALGRGLA